MTWVDFVIRLLLALVLGAAIGIERQWERTRSVLKTNVLVALGAAMFVMMSSMVPGDASPTRVAAQVVSGIGFLGGGVILREGTSIRGLNTAATLWCTAAIGTFVGAGLLFQAYFGALAVVGANFLLRPIVQWFQRLFDEQLVTDTEREARYRCRIICNVEHEARVRALLLSQTQEGELMLTALSSRNINIKEIDNLIQVEVKADFVTDSRKDGVLEQIITVLKSQVATSATSWQLVSKEIE